MHSASRILIAELDSPAQAQRFAAAGPEKAARAVTELTGMLRVGMLVSDSILVTDAMLLDGQYFVTLGPEGVLREVGGSQARYPLTVTGPHATLRDGLRARLEREEFQWSLPNVHSGIVPADVQRSWDEWLRFVEAGLIRYEQQTASAAPLRTGTPPARTEDALARLHASGIGDMAYRSQAWSAIAELELDEAERVDVRTWWTDAYLRMIAENASADWISFDSDTERPLALRAQDIELPLSATVVEWARESTPATIAVAWDASADQRRRLHEKPTWSRMRDLSFAVTQASTAPSRWGVLIGSVMKIGIALVVIALALPGLEIGSIDSPWTWVAFVGAIATTLPFDSLWALKDLLRRDPRARLVLHRAGGAA